MGKWAVLMVVIVSGMYGWAWVGPLVHYTVRLTNRLGPEEMFNAECTFKKSPLGVYAVGYNKHVEWDLPVYEDQVFGCSFYWQNKYVEDAQLFVQTQQGRFCTKDHKCIWELRPDGVYFLHDASSAMGDRVSLWKE